MKLKELNLNNNETYSYYEAGENNNKKLLLIHGNTSGALFFKPIFLELSKEYHVIAPDLRGFGNTTYNQPINTLNDFSQDLKLLLDKLNIDKVNLLGWSLGGTIGLDFSVSYPTMVDKLILLSSGSLKGYPVYKKDANFQPTNEVYKEKSELALDPIQVLPLLNAYQMKNKDFLEQIFNLVIYTGKNKPSKEVNNELFDIVLKQRNLVDVDYALSIFNISNQNGPHGSGDGRINNLKAKVLNIWGNKDVTVPKTMFLENDLLIPNIESIIYEDNGHSVLIDDPERLINDIKHFIE